MAKIDSIFKKEIKRAEPHQRMLIKWLHYTKLVDNKDQYCNERDREEIEALADLIEADGEVLQPLIVRRIDTDEYEIIAGHKRRRACRLLAEERGKEQFAFVPCYVMAGSDAQAKFRLYSSNGFHEKTDDEKLHELEQMKFLLETYPEEFPQVQGGRMVERLARLLNMKKTTVGDYLTISKNLSEKGREKLREGILKKSAALELSALPQKKQDELLDQGAVSYKEIKQIKKEEQSGVPIEKEEKHSRKKIETESSPGNKEFSTETINELIERDKVKEPVPSEDTEEMVCPICGNKAMKGQKFCGECGQRWMEG